MRTLSRISRIAHLARVAGLRPTAARLGQRLFGTQEWLILVRHLKAPPADVGSSAVINGILVREMTEDDVPLAAQEMPLELGLRSQQDREEGLLRCMPNAFVALRDDRLVGAAWFEDCIEAQPWYSYAAPHLNGPARLARGMFVDPNEKKALFAMMTQVNRRLAQRGLQSLVAQIRAGNRPAILMNRMLGGFVVACQRDEYRWGRCATTIRVPDGDDAALPR